MQVRWLFLRRSRVVVGTSGGEEPKLVHRTGPPSRLRRYGAASFAWLAERHPSRGLPSRSSRVGVSSRERRMVDLNSGSWNRLVGWLRNIDAVRLDFSSVGQQLR